MDSNTMKKLFNPVRIKIILTLNTVKICTMKELAKELNDVPQASLYRHIKVLIDLDIIEVVSEKKVRGAVERTLKLKWNPYQEMNQKAIDGDKDALNEVFYHFMIAQLSEFTNYLYKDTTNLVEDGVGFRTYPFYLSEEEHNDFIVHLRELIEKYKDNKARKDRRLRSFSFTYMPSEEK